MVLPSVFVSLSTVTLSALSPAFTSTASLAILATAFLETPTP